MINLFKERGNIFLRLLDRYIGIPLVFLLGLFRKKKNVPERPQTLKSIVIFNMSGIGDSILTFPFIQKLSNTYQEVDITVVCGKNNQAVYQNLLDEQYIKNVICLDLERFIYDWGYLRNKVNELRTTHYDYCFDFESWSRISALLSFLIKGDYKIGYRTEGQHKHMLFDHYEVHRRTKHEFGNYGVLMSLLIDQVQEFPTYPMVPKDQHYFDDFMDNHDIHKYIVFHPWASGYKNTLKELDKGAIIYICNKLADEGYTIIFTGGPTDKDKSEALASCIERSFSIAGNTNLNETAIFLKNANCVITVNTGILHLAAAVGSNLVSVNGPTDINRWGPLSEKAINIESNLFCSPCLDLGFEYKCKRHGVSEGYCMKKIDLDEVISSAINLSKNNKVVDVSSK
jgi:heptosyltransferase I